MLKVIAGPMRLAAKYEIDDILSQLAPVLERDWPSKYEDWLRVEKEFEQNFYEKHPQIPRIGIPMSEYQDPGMMFCSCSCTCLDIVLAASIQLAQQTRLRSVLHPAFYDLSRIYLRKPANQSELSSRWANTSLLTRDDLERLAVGRERIAENFKSGLPFTMELDLIGGLNRSQKKNKCSKKDHGASCSACFQRWLRGYFADRKKMQDLARDPITTLDHMAEDLESKTCKCEHLSHACEVCRSTAARVLRAEAQRFWDELPEIFDLDSLPF